MKTCLKKFNEIMRLKLIISLIISVIIVSCQSNKQTGGAPSGPGKDEMAELNRYLVQKDREIIENYAERKELKMVETSTGLWYSVEKEGSGNLIKENDRIVFSYKCSLLDGTRCYSSEDLGPKQVVLGKSELEPGLNEGLKLLRPGARALFILPPFLAYGFVGDGKKIPPRSIVVYEVEVISVN